MRREYDFSKADKNPYAGKFKRQVTLRLEEQVVAYFKSLAKDADIPYQTLINFYLRDCVETGRKPGIGDRIAWLQAGGCADALTWINTLHLDIFPIWEYIVCIDCWIVE
jgi:hypothetical protein